LLAQASAGIDAAIAAAGFETVTLDFVTGASHAQLGQALEIRLFNLNLEGPSVLPAGSQAIDLEV